MIRIAFVHIPKTAGSAIVHAFEHALGAEACRAFASAIDEAAFAGKRFVSGHVQLSQITPDAFAFTFLREPIAQLASHLRWLDRYNVDTLHAELAKLSPSLRAAVRRVGQVDFAAPSSIAAFFDWLPEASHARLVDVQCEVLAASTDHMRPRAPAERAAAAIATLPRLGFVGLVEQLDRDMARLFRRLDLPRPPMITEQNTLSSPRRIDRTDPAIRRELARHVQADLALYQHVARQRAPWRRALSWR